MMSGKSAICRSFWPTLSELQTMTYIKSWDSVILGVQTFSLYIYIYVIYCILKRKEGGREGARVPLRDGMVDIEVTVPEVESVQYY